MSVDPGPRAAPDAGHLDEDPEACEDPVHTGDARHQHDLHHPPAGDDAEAEAGSPGSDDQDG